MQQSDIFVLDKCEINVDKTYSEPHVDLHKLRNSKSVRLCPAFSYTFYFDFFQTIIPDYMYNQVKHYELCLISLHLNVANLTRLAWVIHTKGG